MLIIGINEGETKAQKKLRDGSCVIIKNSKILAAISEERVIREKRAGGYIAALSLLINKLNISPNQIDLIVTSSCCDNFPSTSLPKPAFKNVKTIACNHHLSHAYSSFFASNFMNAIIIVIDAGGNTLYPDTDKPWWKREREQHSYYIGRRDGIELIQRDFSEPEQAGIGEIFRAFTYYLGWPSSRFAGNTMALAGCSTNSPYVKFKIFDEIDGRIYSKVKNMPQSPFTMVENLLDKYNIKKDPFQPLFSLNNINEKSTKSNDFGV